MLADDRAWRPQCTTMPDADLDPARTARPRPRGRRLGVGLAAAALVLGASACSSDGTGGAGASSSTSAAPTGVTETGSTYGSIASLQEAVVDGGFTCTLEYPGLRDDATDNEVSICTIEDETAYLTVWGDPAKLAEFASSSDGSTGTVALGADWSISVATEDLAGRLAETLGGTAPSGSGPATTTTTPVGT